MTREEMRENAIAELNSAFERYKNHVMNIVDRAWAEGKRSAEMNKAEEIGKDILQSVLKELDRDKTDSKNIYEKHVITGPSFAWTVTADCEVELDIPEACKNSSNHPSNGGSGICHCTVGNYTTCSTTGDTHE